MKARSVCIDGPARGTALDVTVAKNASVQILVYVEENGRTNSRLARYKGVGQHPSVPLADGVGLEFVEYVEVENPDVRRSG